MIAMNKTFPIFTEPAECQDCYKCLRECPVKAIRILDNKASIIVEECIVCGHCVEVCPAGAKRVRNDMLRCQNILTQPNPVILSLAPSWRGYFDINESELEAKCLKLGFTAIQETSIGADRFSTESVKWMQQNNQTGISTACPAVSAYIQKHYPEMNKYLVPVASPLLLHCRLIKEKYGSNVKVVFAGPCFAKKLESDLSPEELFCALTFEEIENLMDNVVPVILEDVTSSTSEFVTGTIGQFFPVEGGICKSISELSTDFELYELSGLSDIEQFCNSFTPSDKNMYIELSACRGSCINGPVMQKKGSIISRKQKVKVNLPENREFRESYQEFSKKEKEFPNENMEFSNANKEFQTSYQFTNPKSNLEIDITTPFIIAPLESVEFSYNQVKDVLKTVGKNNIQDEKNCGGCGYSTCRDFATAVLQNKAEKQMCLSWLRRISEQKADALIKAMPSSTVIIDTHGRIVDCNIAFARIAGEEALLTFNAANGLYGVKLKKIIPFYHDFLSVIETGINLINKTWNHNGKVLEGSIFIIEQGSLAGAVIQDVTKPCVNRDRIVRQSKQVLEQNVKTVQQIAFLLGENASQTELILNSIVDSFSTGNNVIDQIKEE